MTALNLIYLFFLALFIALFFTYVIKARGPWGKFWPFFIVLFLSVWAADLWISPIGPYWKEVYWFRPLVAGLFIAFLLAAAAPSPQTRNRIDNSREDVLEKEESAVIALSAFFWITIFAISAIIVTGIALAV